MGKQERSSVSPPLARGIHDLLLVRSTQMGATPAGAGSTVLYNRARSAIWAHPRMCGEIHGRSFPYALLQAHPRSCGECETISTSTGAETGPPPHVRGNSMDLVWTALLIRDHPRVCGEYRLRRSDSSTLEGSPPHVRGILVVSRDVIVDDRTTPARAGKWRAGQSRKAGLGTTPACAGNTPSRSPIEVSAPGPPPRVRGIHLMTSQFSFHYRVSETT